MPGPGMEYIGEEEIQEVLEVLRGGYLFRYGVSLGDEVDPRFKRKVYQSEQAVAEFGAVYKGRVVGSIGKVGACSFNVYKTITSGDGGMVVTDDEELYERCFAFHDQGHSPLRTGVEIGKRPFFGLDFRFTELQAAV